MRKRESTKPARTEVPKKAAGLRRAKSSTKSTSSPTLRFWIGLHGPAGMPPAVVQKLNDALNKALASPELRERFAALGADPLPITPQELASYTRSSLEQITRTIKAAGIRAE